MFDHEVVGYRWGVDGLLHKAKEELAPAARSAAIEAESEFIEVLGQVLVGRATNPHRFPATAVRATETVWPAKLFQVSSTRLLGRKTALEFLNIARIVLHTPNLYVGAS